MRPTTASDSIGLRTVATKPEESAHKRGEMLQGGAPEWFECENGHSGSMLKDGESRTLRCGHLRDKRCTNGEKWQTCEKEEQNVNHRGGAYITKGWTAS